MGEIEVIVRHSGKSWGGCDLHTKVFPNETETLLTFLQGQAWQEDPRPLAADPEELRKGHNARRVARRRAKGVGGEQPVRAAQPPTLRA